MSSLTNFLGAGQNVYTSFCELMERCDDGLNKSEQVVLMHYARLKSNELVINKTASLALGTLLAYQNWEIMLLGWAAAKVRPQTVEKLRQAAVVVWKDTDAGKLVLISTAFAIGTVLPWPTAALLYGIWSGQVNAPKEEEKVITFSDRINHVLEAAFELLRPVV